MIDKILLAVDGSQNAQRAVDLAAELAGKLNANMFIVHVTMRGRPAEELVHMAEVEHLVKEVQTVISPGIAYVTGSHPEFLGGSRTDPRTENIISVLGEQIVARAKKRCAERGVNNAKTSVRAGDYAEEILGAANEFNVDMIVIGSRGLGVLKSTVLGSVSQKVLHNADCSVLTVR
ncbi:universal stress protein [Aliiroseovarius sp. S1339]|uniref:universal stress protein n=1 Tax=Aliiroseovarius sp. S1339 TaxID=2936990 RepID=UPI0020C0C3E4|nr:universal stress protein [Aliiroseovarius sp. S1339]MCK8462436.1 universal stress protein [Aliiroseovarius sp. S1339]